MLYGVSKMEHLSFTKSCHPVLEPSFSKSVAFGDLAQWLWEIVIRGLTFQLEMWQSLHYRSVYFHETLVK